MKKVFEKHSGSMEQLQAEAMATFDNFTDPFLRVATTYMQNRTIQELFSQVEPEEIVISHTACRVKSGNSRVLAIKKKCFYYVPLLQSLEQLFTDSRILSMIAIGPQKCKDGFLYDIVDGELFKSHPLFSVRPTALQLILYTDEIEICNPLGSHASKNKLLMVYYTLGNIDPKYRSKLAAIRLLAMAKANYLTQCGVDVILERIQKDLDLLYHGVKIQTVNGEMDMFGALISICGDTLAQQELAGFKEGVGFAYSKCRHCECTFEDMQRDFTENSFVRRTLDMHVRQCLEIEKARTDFLKNSLKTTYGINRKSKLVDFPAFDLIQQTPQDIMHIVLEGIAPMEIKCVLKHLILSGQMDLDMFNDAMLSFPYSPLDIRDRPCPITVNTLASNDNKLKQSSGQMLVLLKILPFLMNNVEGNVYMQLILEVIEITQILFAPVISLQTISRLRLLIEQHLKHFKQLFPDNNIIPKQHYLLHLPTQIMSLGPMVRHMCMRFESKHCFFKQWSSKLNFKNVCKSLVKHNQMFECSQNVNGPQHPIFSSERELGPVLEVKNIQHVQGKMRDFVGDDKMQHVVSVKWLVLNGNKYTCKKSLIVTKVNDNVPEFGLIQDILVVNSSFYCFEYQPYDTLHLNRDFLAYEVDVPNLAQATELVDAEKLVDFTSYYSFSFKSSMYVPVKYYLGDVIALHRSTNDS